MSDLLEQVHGSLPSRTSSVGALETFTPNASCSVYSLSVGTVVFQWLNGTFSKNMSTSFLPAYYITNCLLDSLQDFLNLVNFTDITLPQSKVDLSRNSGNLFVALLFVVSGNCVLAWMLIVLLYLSPKYKQKPLLAQLATIFYAIVCTILLTQVTSGASMQYYQDTLDLLGIQSNVYEPTSYRATIVVLQCFTFLSFLQIIHHMTKNNYRRISMLIGGLLFIGYIVCLGVFEAVFDNSFDYNATDPYMTWDMATRVLKILFMWQVALTLFCYTMFLKNPAVISYNKRVAGVGILTWVLYALHLTVCLLALTIFRVENLNKLWLSYLPQIIELFLITSIWEWIFSIATIERREEMMDVLGRRLSIDNEVMSLKSVSKGSGLLGPVDLSILKRIKRRFAQNPAGPQAQHNNPNITVNSWQSHPMKTFTSSDTDATDTARDTTTGGETSASREMNPQGIHELHRDISSDASYELANFHGYSSSVSAEHLDYEMDDSEDDT